MQNKIIITMVILLWALFDTNVLNASLSVHPLLIKDTVLLGDNKTLKFHITNVGPTSSLSYQITSTTGWLDISPLAGEIKVKDTANIVVSIVSAKLKPGVNKTEITIGDPHHGPITIPVEIIALTSTDVNDENVINPVIKILPNPILDEGYLELNLSESEFADINIIDLNGRKILNLANQTLNKGINKFFINGSNLIPGMYFLTITTNNKNLIEQLIKIK